MCTNAGTTTEKNIADAADAATINIRPDSPAESPPEEATAPKETDSPAVAPEAEESPQETAVDEPPPPPAKKSWWFGRAKPEPEPEEAERPPPLSPFSTLRAQREQELAFEPEA